MRYSALRILKESLTGNKGWTPAWRDPEPKSGYDVIIIGGGGHGLATAHYLSKMHGVTCRSEELSICFIVTRSAMRMFGAATQCGWPAPTQSY